MPASLYKPEYAEQARKLCILGATDPDLCDFFGVGRRTLNDWKLRYPEFTEALKSGKDFADERVERSLYQKALGYEMEVEKAFHHQGSITKATVKEYFPPDTVACIFWLKNRRQLQWRDVHKHEHGKPGDFTAMTDEELNDFIARGQGTVSVGDSRKEEKADKKGVRGKSNGLH